MAGEHWLRRLLGERPFHWVKLLSKRWASGEHASANDGHKDEAPDLHWGLLFDRENDRNIPPLRRLTHRSERTNCLVDYRLKNRVCAAAQNRPATSSFVAKPETDPLSTGEKRLTLFGAHHIKILCCALHSSFILYHIARQALANRCRKRLTRRLLKNTALPRPLLPLQQLIPKRRTSTALAAASFGRSSGGISASTF